jgi:hypothetical protein
MAFGDDALVAYPHLLKVLDLEQNFQSVGAICPKQA